MSKGSSMMLCFVLHWSALPLNRLPSPPSPSPLPSVAAAARHFNRCASFAVRACCIVSVVSVHVAAACPSLSCCSETAVALLSKRTFWNRTANCGGGGGGGGGCGDGDCFGECDEWSGCDPSKAGAGPPPTLCRTVRSSQTCGGSGSIGAFRYDESSELSTSA